MLEILYNVMQRPVGHDQRVYSTIACCDNPTEREQSTTPQYLSAIRLCECSVCIAIITMEYQITSNVH